MVSRYKFKSPTMENLKSCLMNLIMELLFLLLQVVDSLVPLAERDVGTLRGMTKACASYIG